MTVTCAVVPLRANAIYLSREGNLLDGNTAVKSEYNHKLNFQVNGQIPEVTACPTSSGALCADVTWKVFLMQ